MEWSHFSAIRGRLILKSIALACVSAPHRSKNDMGARTQGDATVGIKHDPVKPSNTRLCFAVRDFPSRGRL